MFPEATGSWLLLILSQPAAQVLGITPVYLLMQPKELDRWVSMTLECTHAFCFRPHVLFPFVYGFVVIINFLFEKKWCDSYICLAAADNSLFLFSGNNKSCMNIISQFLSFKNGIWCQ